MHDEARVTRIPRLRRTDRDIGLIRSSIIQVSQSDRLVSQSGTAIRLRRDQNGLGCRTLLPTLGRTRGHIRSEIAELQRNRRAPRRRRFRGPYGGRFLVGSEITRLGGGAFRPSTTADGGTALSPNSVGVTAQLPITKVTRKQRDAMTVSIFIGGRLLPLRVAVWETT